MSEIQYQASLIIEPMLDHGFERQFRLSAADLASLTAWTTMTAMTAEFLPIPIPETGHFTQEERETFRGTRMPPDHTIVSSAQYHGNRATQSVSTHPAAPIVDPLKGGPTTADLFVATISLLSVVFQLVHFRGALKAAGDRPSVQIEIRDPMSDATVEIWPASSSIEWPPEELLDEEGLDLYARRWNPTGTE